MSTTLHEARLRNEQEQWPEFKQVMASYADYGDLVRERANVYRRAAWIDKVERPALYALIDRAAHRERKLADALGRALDPFIDDEPCRFDHHGNCQAHMVDNPCSVVTAREALRQWREARKAQGGAE